MAMPKQLLALVVALLPAAAFARPWMGITPGESARAEVLSRFGEPSKRLKQGDKELLAYTSDRAIKGTTQVQFTVLPDGKVEQIVVFPAPTLDVGEIEDSFGKACSSLTRPEQARGTCYVRQLTDDFRTFFWYKRMGLVVFLNEDKKTVHSLLFNAPVAAEAAAVIP